MKPEAQLAIQKAWHLTQQAADQLLSAHQPDLETNSKDSLAKAREYLLKSYETTKSADQILDQKES